MNLTKKILATAMTLITSLSMTISEARSKPFTSTIMHKLEVETAQLVLPGASEFSVEIPVNSREDDRQKEYTGQLTDAIYLKIARGAKSEERIITFP